MFYSRCVIHCALAQVVILTVRVTPRRNVITYHWSVTTTNVKDEDESVLGKIVRITQVGPQQSGYFQN